MERAITDDHPLSIHYAIQLIDVTVQLNKKLVLRSISLSIEPGGIFALLGPSGCGKTTLIRTLTGRLVPIQYQDVNRGKILILGRTPHAFGQLVGFMPQEMALHLTHTIGEELFFYGRLTNMSSQKIHQRISFLSHLLDLPARNKFIERLSGGQQRRVSFAIALLHEPKLLILDEPTVGVDPVLRKKIWRHLTEITADGNVTAILTTHYIEEARQANRISFMRHGQLLETGEPDELLTKHQHISLEEVFLDLCEERSNSLIQNNDQDNKISLGLSSIAYENIRSKDISKNIIAHCCCVSSNIFKGPFLSRSFRALLVKDVIKFRRNPFMLIMQFLVPILQITLFCLCVGRKLTNLPMGFISREHVRSNSFTELIFNKIDQNVLRLMEYQSIDLAYEHLKAGSIVGIFEVGANFSRELMDKMQHCVLDDANKYQDSQLSIFVDQTNRQLVYSVAEEFFRVLKIIDIEFNLGFWRVKNSNQSLFQLRGSTDDVLNLEFTFTHFMVPGIVLSVIFFFNVALTALSLVIEQNDGTQERVWIIGIKTSEIILSQLIIHSIILIIQTIIVLFTALYLFQIPSKGSLIWSSLLCFLQGLCGMTFGLFISTIFTTEINAHQITMATFYPVLLLSGIVWPLEGQPSWMRIVTKWLPMTKAIEAMRGILLKGWSIEYFIVQQAYLVTVAWATVFFILTLLILICRQP